MRIEVSASELGLAGQSVNGLMFHVVGGRAAFGPLGVARGPDRTALGDGGAGEGVRGDWCRRHLGRGGGRRCRHAVRARSGHDRRGRATAVGRVRDAAGESGPRRAQGPRPARCRGSDRNRAATSAARRPAQVHPVPRRPRAPGRRHRRFQLPAHPYQPVPGAPVGAEAGRFGALRHLARHRPDRRVRQRRREPRATGRFLPVDQGHACGRYQVPTPSGPASPTAPRAMAAPSAAIRVADSAGSAALSVGGTKSINTFAGTEKSTLAFGGEITQRSFSDEVLGEVLLGARPADKQFALPATEAVQGPRPIYGKSEVRTVSIASRLEQSRSVEAKNFAAATRHDVVRQLAQIEIDVDDLDVFGIAEEGKFEASGQPSRTGRQALSAFRDGAALTRLLQDPSPQAGMEDEANYFLGGIELSDFAVATLRGVEGRIRQYKVALEACRAALAEIERALLLADQRLAVVRTRTDRGAQRRGERPRPLRRGAGAGAAHQCAARCHHCRACHLPRLQPLPHQRQPGRRAVARPRLRTGGAGGSGVSGRPRRAAAGTARHAGRGARRAPAVVPGAAPAAAAAGYLAVAVERPARRVGDGDADPERGTVLLADPDGGDSGAGAAPQPERGHGAPAGGAAGAQRCPAQRCDGGGGARLAKPVRSRPRRPFHRRPAGCAARPAGSGAPRCGGVLPHRPHRRLPPRQAVRGAAGAAPGLGRAFQPVRQRVDFLAGTRGDLTRLPRFLEIDEDLREDLMDLAQWLVRRVDAAVPEALGLMNDLLRVCVLAASHSPVNEIVTGRLPRPVRIGVGKLIDVLALRPDKVRVGMLVSLFKGDQVAAQAVVSDVKASAVSVQVVQAIAAEVELEADARVHFSLAGMTSAMDGAKKNVMATAFGAMAGR
ncbi:MAG: hypothetical protein MZV63_40230 [Marinilabiliales bacterium]|nr:hypothetical protein [Marinilabiliales bacterium]